MIKEAIMNTQSNKSQVGQTKVKKRCNNCGGRGNPIQARVISQSTHKSVKNQTMLNTKELTSLNEEISNGSKTIRSIPIRLIQSLM